MHLKKIIYQYNLVDNQTTHYSLWMNGSAERSVKITEKLFIILFR